MKNKKGQGPVEIKTQNGTRRLEVRRNKGSTARNSVKTKHNQKSQKKPQKTKKNSVMALLSMAITTGKRVRAVGIKNAKKKKDTKNKTKNSVHRKKKPGNRFGIHYLKTK